MSDSATELYREGRLQDAIAAVGTALRSHPTDLSSRWFLCELLCVAGHLERADKQLEIIAQQDPQAMTGVGLTRHLIRAEQARHDFYAAGRIPEFVTPPSERIQLYLQASIALREGQLDEGARLLVEAEDQRPVLEGRWEDQSFDDFRDLDDLTASVFEVLTSTGKYYWVPMDQVVELEFRKPERPVDLLWVRAHMIVRDGPEGEVYIPAVYAADGSTLGETHLLGRITEWRGAEEAPVRGAGLRSFLVGGECQTIFELTKLTFGGEGGE